MTRLLVPLSIIAVSCFANTALSDDDGPAGDVPELKVLANYVGIWDVVAGAADNPSAKGTYSVRWTLDGHYIQTNGSVKTADGSNDFKLTALMTYDAQNKRYRVWTFMSNGMMTEAEATWDAESRTMTKVTRYGDITQTAKSEFSKPGVETWTLVARDKDDNVVSEMRGTNTRRKQ